MLAIMQRCGSAEAEGVLDVSAASLLYHINDSIEPYGEVHTDSLGSYNKLQKLGFNHKRINHNKGYLQGGACTNGIGEFWSYVKERLRVIIGVSNKHFHL